MGFLLVILAIVVILHYVLPPPGSEINKDVKKECPPHKWFWDDTGFLKCALCGKRPGYEGRE